MFAERLNDAFKQLGVFNLALFGKTGAGKSTLVNAVFGRDVAITGMGKPITRGLDYYRHQDGFLGVYDSEGFETGTSGDAILNGLRKVVGDRRAGDLSEQIHAVWYVVRWSDRRFEDRQAQFVDALAGMGLPVLLVMTQVPTRDHMVHPDAVELAKYIEGLRLPTRPDGRVLLTNAKKDDFTGSPVFGLKDLLDATYAVVPEAAENALTAAQVLDLERKRHAARKVINQASAISAGIGATPIPIADAALLIPHQVAMMAKITAAYGLPPVKTNLISQAGILVLTSGATMVGRYAVTNLLKFIPGGNVAGSAISATVAGTLTKSVGLAWSRVCEYSLRLDPAMFDEFWTSKDVQDRFVSYLKDSKLSSVLPSGKGQLEA